MKLTERTTQQLLDSLIHICKADYVQVVDTLDHSKAASKERYSCGELNDALQVLHKRPINEFLHEIEYFLDDYRIAFTLVSPMRLFIVVSQRDIEPQHNEQRRQTVTHEHSSRKLEIEILASTALPRQIQSMAEQEQTITTGDIACLLLNQCAALLNSLKVFSQLQQLTTDSLTKLQSRTALQSAIDDSNRIAGVNLCMIHCRDFQVVNRKFGQAKGDQVLNEIAKIITQFTRSDDIACRFGGALFGISSNAGNVQEGVLLAQKLQNELHNRPYLQNAIRLSFNVGVAHLPKDEAIDKDSSASGVIIHRAEQALKAAQTSDKPSIVHWEADKFSHDEQEYNYLGGIFTPDNVTNYRNMLLLWDISSIIADEHEFNRLLFNVVERLANTFEFSLAGIVSTQADHAFEQAIEVSQMADIKSIAFEHVEHRDIIKKTAHQAIANASHVELQHQQDRLLVVPLGSELEACLFLLGDEQTLNLTHESVMLFAGFARQIGKALKRNQLEEELNRNLEQQNAQLEEELKTLKTGLQSSALVYRSAAMQEIVEQTQRAAQTDTTILVTGESGTGKEKLIHAIHNLSPRANKPLIIVDCGSIPETLIESELFGYVKGAFTGAQSQSTGKIQAADGGILVLDEIGELPLSMQPKLLRFVQEKHYTPVGGNRAIDVDVKIVAVTNRDLAKEVERGRFRQDLYYRLNVVKLHNPPLRDRLEDLPMLSQHFLTKFANQFETSRKFLSESTLSRMSHYGWPGNIRELENKLMQASLMCQGNEIEYTDLNISSSNEPATRDAKVINLTADEAIAAPDDFEDASSNYERNRLSSATSNNTDAHSTNNAPLKKEDWEEQLRDALNLLIAQVIQTPSLYNSEIGIWVEQSLLVDTLTLCKTNKDIAQRLQIPVSTARRKALKAKNFALQNYPDTWPAVAQLLQAIARGEITLSQPLDSLKLMLLELILAQNPVNMTHAAQLLGVSEPTMYKLKRQL